MTLGTILLMVLVLMLVCVRQRTDDGPRSGNI
jgi:hypothetical protein